MRWCHFYSHSLIIISPLVSILAAVHTERDEPKTIRHKAPSDTLWTEQLSNSLCAAAVHSGTFVGGRVGFGSRCLRGPGIPANSVWQETFVSHLAGELEWVERILVFLQLQDLSRFVTFQTMRNWRERKSQKPQNRAITDWKSGHMGSSWLDGWVQGQTRQYLAANSVSSEGTQKLQCKLYLREVREWKHCWCDCRVVHGSHITEKIKVVTQMPHPGMTHYDFCTHALHMHSGLLFLEIHKE